MLTKYILIGIVVAVILQRLLAVRLSDRSSVPYLILHSQRTILLCFIF